MRFRSFLDVSLASFHKLSCAVLLAGLGAIVACGADGGIGEACDTAGSVDECVEGGVCEEDASGDAVCLEICETQDDCESGYSCNGVSNTNIKACHLEQ